jgi:hypothetical protein
VGCNEQGRGMARRRRGLSPPKLRMGSGGQSANTTGLPIVASLSGSGGRRAGLPYEVLSSPEGLG